MSKVCRVCDSKGIRDQRISTFFFGSWPGTLAHEKTPKRHFWRFLLRGFVGHESPESIFFCHFLLTFGF